MKSDKELVEALETLPRRKGRISGQLFSYVKLEDVLAVIEAAARLRALTAEPDEAMVEQAAKAGWNACRKSVYAVCEDVEREAEDAAKHKGEHAKGYANGMARAAKSIARGFGSMEAEDDDNFRAALSASPRREGWPIGTSVEIAHDGFAGTVQGYYTTREGKRGVVLQQHDTRVVHVYGEKWLAAAPQ